MLFAILMIYCFCCIVAGVAMYIISKRKIKFYEENNLDPYYRDDDELQEP